MVTVGTVGLRLQKEQLSQGYSKSAELRTPEPVLGFKIQDSRFKMQPQLQASGFTRFNVQGIGYRPRCPGLRVLRI